MAWLTDKAGFEAAKKHLESRRIQFGEQGHGTSRSIYFSDPDGNPLEITFYTYNYMMIRMSRERPITGYVGGGAVASIASSLSSFAVLSLELISAPRRTAVALQ